MIKEKLKQEHKEEIDILFRMSKENLVKIIIDDARNWLAHDGLWFQAVEKMYGMEAAIEADSIAWEKFAAIEVRRIMKRLGMEPGGGIPSLVECFRHRMYARLNKQEITEISPEKIRLKIMDCPVQSARKRKNLPDFPCKSVGIIEFTEVARVVDPVISVCCVTCPPDRHPEEYWCEWEFSKESESGS